MPQQNTYIIVHLILHLTLFSMLLIRPVRPPMVRRVCDAWDWCKTFLVQRLCTTVGLVENALTLLYARISTDLNITKHLSAVRGHDTPVWHGYEPDYFRSKVVRFRRLLKLNLVLILLA